MQNAMFQYKGTQEAAVPVRVKGKHNLKKENKKRVLILSYYRYPCSHPVLENVFAKELGKICNIVWLFQGEANATEGRRRWHNSDLHFCKKVHGKSRVSDLVNKILECTKLFKAIKLVCRGKINIILVRDLPIYAVLIAPLRYFVRFKLYFQYSAPQGDISISYAKRIRGLKQYWYLLKGYGFNFFINKALRASDVVFPISEFHKNQLTQLIGPKEMAPITMGVDTNWLELKNNNIKYLNDLKKNNKLITYFGSLSFSRNPHFIINVFAEVKQQFPNCKLIIMGAGVNSKEEASLRELSQNLELSQDVIFTGRVSRQIVKDCLAYSDVTISAIPPESHYRISSPTKLYESMGLGVPVIANIGISEQEKVIEESGAGLLVKYDINEFCNAIVHLLNNPELVQKMAERGRTYVLKNYTYEVIASNVANYFR